MSVAKMSLFFFQLLLQLVYRYPTKNLVKFYGSDYCLINWKICNGLWVSICCRKTGRVSVLKDDMKTVGAGNIFHPLTPVMQLGHVQLHAGARPSKTHLKFHPFFGIHEKKKEIDLLRFMLCFSQFTSLNYGGQLETLQSTSTSQLI